MYTIRFFVKPHLASYMYHRYKKTVESGAIRLPYNSILYHTLHQLTTRRPSGKVPREKGNLALILPFSSIGKSPATYNYLSEQSILTLEMAIDVQMKMELYEFIRFNKFRKGIMYMTSARLFQNKHQMWDITEEALIKSYQRWRDREKKERKEE